MCFEGVPAHPYISEGTGLHEKSNPSRFRFEIDLSPSGSRVVFEFCLDLLGEVGKQHDVVIV